MKRRQLKGALHVHSSISYDGILSVEELCCFFRRKKFDFVLMTEHSEKLSKVTMNQLIDECKRLSSPEFLMIPGLEFSCENGIHILGLGVNGISESDNSLQVTQHIHQQGGVAVLAHPTKQGCSLDGAWIEELDGVEIWNSAYDGKFLPQAESIKTFKKLAEQNPHLKPFAGMDLHRVKDYYDVALRVKGSNLKQDQILRDLKEGNFTVESPFFSIKPGTQITPVSLLFIFAFRKVLNVVRSLRDLLGGG